MAWVSHEHRLVFFAAPATGSTAIIRAFEKAGIGEAYPPETLVKGDRTITRSKHSTVRELKAGGLYSPVAGYFKCVGVRSVYPWFVARYLRNTTKRLKIVRKNRGFVRRMPEADRRRYVEQIKKQAEMTFGEFLHERLDRRKAVHPQKRYHEGMDFFIHQESMDEDFAELVRRAGLPAGLKVPLTNVTGAMDEGRTWRDFYDAELTELVRQKCAPFFRQFPEYGFDGLDAAQAAARHEHGAA